MCFCRLTMLKWHSIARASATFLHNPQNGISVSRARETLERKRRLVESRPALAVLLLHRHLRINHSSCRCEHFFGKVATVRDAWISWGRVDAHVRVDVVLQVDPELNHHPNA
jgi:hypothetical protein